MEKEGCSRELQCTCTYSKSNHPSLDLKLSIGSQAAAIDPSNGIQERQWQRASEQVRLAGIERVYAEQVRELARREIEMAEEEFARARVVLERARQEVQNVERMKEMSVRKVSPTSAVITCWNCHHYFTS